MLSISNLLCDHQSGNEKLRYGHRAHRDAAAAKSGVTVESQQVPRPVVVWAVTRACNLKCVHCYASAEREPDANELTYDEGVALLEDCKAFDVPAVLFSGGEPMMRPDLDDLLHHANTIGLRTTLSTNGTMIDAERAAQFAELGLTYVGISIDGMRDRHDKLRGERGSFDATLRGIDHCRAAGIRVGLRFTVHALNQDDLADIFQLCHDHDIQRLCVYHLAYAGRGGKMQAVDLTAEQTRQIVDRIFKMTRQSHAEGKPLEVLTVGNHTDAAYLVEHLKQHDPQQAQQVIQRLQRTGGNRSGCNISSVDPIGNVHYDQFSWHYTCGNVRQQPFSSIWSQATDERLALLRDRQAALPQTCQQCQYLSICNGNLRTRAEVATGDWMGMDPSCYLTDAERGIEAEALSALKQII